MTDPANVGRDIDAFHPAGDPESPQAGTAREGRTERLVPLVNRVLRPGEVTALRRRGAGPPADCDTGLERSTA